MSRKIGYVLKSDPGKKSIAINIKNIIAALPRSGCSTIKPMAAPQVKGAG